MTRMKRFALGTTVVAILVVVTAEAAELPVPLEPMSAVTDLAHVLADPERRAIEEDLNALRSRTGIEVAIVLLPDLAGLPIEDATLAVGRRWGVGGEGDRGVLVLLAIADHEARIEVGYGLEGVIPDLAAKAIIEDVMTPAFREGEYGQGLLNGVRAIAAQVTEGEGGGATSPQRAPLFTGLPLYAFFILLQWILVVLARTKSWWLGGVIGAGIGGVVFTTTSAIITIPLFAILGIIVGDGRDKLHVHQVSWS